MPKLQLQAAVYHSFHVRAAFEMSYSRYYRPSLKAGIDIQLANAYNEGNWASVIRLAEKRGKTMNDPYYDVRCPGCDTSTKSCGAPELCIHRLADRFMPLLGTQIRRRIPTRQPPREILGRLRSRCAPAQADLRAQS
jgi:hypothetical protein